jgi:hypothetical protein
MIRSFNILLPAVVFLLIGLASLVCWWNAGSHLRPDTTNWDLATGYKSPLEAQANSVYWKVVTFVFGTRSTEVDLAQQYLDAVEGDLTTVHSREFELKKRQSELGAWLQSNSHKVHNKVSLSFSFMCSHLSLSSLWKKGIQLSQSWWKPKLNVYF